MARTNVPGVEHIEFDDNLPDAEILSRAQALASRIRQYPPGMDNSMPDEEGISRSRSRVGTYSKDIAESDRSLLDVIAGTEAPDYNTLYGGRKISDLSKHPGIHVPIKKGPNAGDTSSAFGRYQFEKATWDEVSKELGLEDMSPHNQDLGALHYAAKIYKAKTGRDVSEDWASGDPEMQHNVLRNLSGVWTSLPGGIEQNPIYGKQRLAQPDRGGAPTSRISDTGFEDQQPQFRYDPSGRPTSDIFKGALARGWEGLKGDYLDLIPAMAASVFNEDEYAKEQLQEYKDRMEDVRGEYPVAYEDISQVNDPVEFLDYAAETLGENAANAATFLMGAGVGSSIGKAAVRKSIESKLAEHVAKREGLDDAGREVLKNKLMDRIVAGSMAGRVGAGTGMAAASAASNIPETFQDIYQETGELHPGVASMFGSVKAGLDTVIPGHVLGKLSGASRDMLTAKILDKMGVLPTSYTKAFLAEAGIATAGEGITEGVQQYIDNLAAKYVGSDRDSLEKVFDSAVRGMIGGAVIGAPGAAVEAGRYPAYKYKLDREARLKAGAPAQPPGTERISAPAIPPEISDETTGQAAPPSGLSDAGYSSVISADMLAGVGLDKKRNQWIFKNLAGKDFLDEADYAEVAKFLSKLGSNDKIDPEIKAKIIDLIEEHSSNVQRALESGIEAGPSGVGAGVSEQPGAGIPTEGAGVPPATGMGADTSSVSGTEGGAPVQQGTLEADPLHFQALSHVLQTNSGSTSGLARALNISLDRADNILNDLQESGYVSAPDAKGQRTVTVPDFNAELLLQEAIEEEGVDLEAAKARTLENLKVTRARQEAEAQTEEVRKARTVRGLQTTQAQQRAETAATQQRDLEAREIQLRGEVRALKDALENATGKRDTSAIAQLTDQLNAVESQLQTTTRDRATAAAVRLTEKHPTDGAHGYATDFDIQDQGDQQSVAAVRTKKKVKGDEKHANTYFGKTGVLQHALANIAYDLVFPAPRFRVQPDEVGLESTKLFEGTGTKEAESAAKWVQDNLSAETNEELNRLVQYFQGMKDKTEASDKVRWDEQVVETDTGRERAMPRTPAPTGDLYFRTDEAAKQAPVATLTAEELEKGVGGKGVSSMAHPVHPAVLDALRKGNLAQALLLHASRITGNQSKLARFLSSVFSGRSEIGDQSRVARQLAKNLRGTNVKVSLGLTDANGKPVPGYYDPATNTVHLDATDGLNSHTLIHESGHAVLSHTLDDADNPLTRNLTQLFDKVKDSLGGAYGAQSVHEFTSEAWGNEEFKNQLQGINPDGLKYTAWDRFIRAVSNFFRRAIGLPSKPLDSMYDAVDKLISEIASPAPKNRGGNILYGPGGAKYAYSTVDKIIDKIPLINEGQKAALSDAINFGDREIGSAIKAFLPMHALADIADQYLGNLPTKVHDLINQRSGLTKKLNKMTDPVTAMAKNAIKKAGHQQNEYGDIVHRSTRAGVDPTKPRQIYKNDPEKEKIWDNLNRRYNRLDKSWQDTYVAMRNGYRAMYDEIKKTIFDRIDETDMPQASKVRLRADIMSKLMEKGRIDPYFALGRSGEYWMSANTFDQEGRPLFVVEAFESKWKRRARMRQLERGGATEIQPYSNLQSLDYSRAPDGSFVNSVLKIMRANKVPDEAVDEMMRLFISTLPETAFAKSMMARKDGGRAGFDTDAVGVFEKKMRSMAHQIASMKYNPKIRNTIADMESYANDISKGGIEAKDKNGKVIKDEQGQPTYLPAKDNEIPMRYVEEFKKREKFILNPTKDFWGQLLTTGLFHYVMGANVSSVLVNFANIPMVVAPYLNSQYPGQSISGAIGHATRVFAGSGRKAEVEMIGARGEKVMMDVMPSVANYAPDSKYGKQYATLVEVLNEHGQLDRSQLYEMIRGDTSTGTLDKINAASGWAFHHGERMNREVTMMATYDLEVKKLAAQVRAGKMTAKEAEEAAAYKAIQTAELTNGSVASASAPRVAQNFLGKVAFMFKRYAATHYYMLWKAFTQATDKLLSPAERKMARKQLAGIYGMAGLMAGVQGLPLFGLLSMIYNAFKDDEDDDFGTLTRNYIGEFYYKGPIEYFTNLSVASRMSINDMIVRTANEKAEATTFAQQMAEVIGGAAFSVGERVERGLDLIREGHTERGIEMMLPVFAANMFKAVRYGLEGTNTLRGDPITGDVSLGNVAAQFIGIAPADYTRQMEENARLKGMHDKVIRKASNLKRKYYIADRAGDLEAKDEAREQLIELGEKHPGLEISRGNVGSSLRRSMKAQQAATKEMRHGIRYSKKMLKEIQEKEREWEEAE
jgi:muramidase (phage lysozyme)